MIRIPFLDLKSATDEIKLELENSISRVVLSGMYIGGDVVSRFESSFSEFVDCKHAIGVGNGLDALKIALLALDIGPGDQVIVPSHTFIATWLAVSSIGAKPIPVSVDDMTYNLDPSHIRGAITEKTKAIIVVHLYGRPADLTAIESIAREYGIQIIEDAAQAHGATYYGKRIGSRNNICCWSFYPGKNLGALGDGGAITTNNDVLAQKMRMLSNYGSSEKYSHTVKGVNSRLDPIQAAALSVKLERLDDWNNRRHLLAKKYLSGIRTEQISLPPVDDICVSSWHLFVIRCKNRSKLVDYLKLNQIETVIHYPIPPFRQLCYKDEYLGFNCSKTMEICDEILSIPMGPHLSEAQSDFIIDSLNSFGK